MRIRVCHADRRPDHSSMNEERPSLQAMDRLRVLYSGLMLAEA
jgi:hypothetical protein